MSDWRPMETAPKDGTPVLIYFPRIGSQRRGQAVAYYHRVSGSWVTHPGMYNRSPTHWMPLPDPPDPTP